jgi:alkaline phosphatase D
VSTSITSQGPGARSSEALRGANPHIRHADGTVRGYHLLEIGRDGLQARVRGVATVKQPDAAVSTVATARVVAGRPGLAE